MTFNCPLFPKYSPDRILTPNLPRIFARNTLPYRSRPTRGRIFLMAQSSLAMRRLHPCSTCATDSRVPASRAARSGPVYKYSPSRTWSLKPHMSRHGACGGRAELPFWDLARRMHANASLNLPRHCTLPGHRLQYTANSPRCAHIIAPSPS